jgi:hypothetical protein
MLIKTLLYNYLYIIMNHSFIFGGIFSTILFLNIKILSNYSKTKLITTFYYLLRIDKHVLEDTFDLPLFYKKYKQLNYDEHSYFIY